MQGLGNDIIPGAEQIALLGQLKNVQQAGQRLIVGFGFAIGQDMLNGDAALCQIAGYQQGAVAFQGFLFAAQQGDAAVVGAADDAADAVVKAVGFGNPVVDYPPVGIVAGTVGGPAAQLPAEEGIADADIVQQPGQGIVIEVRRV